jgi:serine/threonine protein kinase
MAQPERPLHNRSSSKPSKHTLGKKFAREKAERFYRERYPYNDVSAFLENHTKLSKQEILQGDVLGKGAFGIVWEVNGICSNSSAESSVVDLSRPDATNPKISAQHFTPPHSQQQQQQKQNEQKLYAMKALSKVTVKDTNLLCQGIFDLVMEARLLSQIEPHPHVIKMRAVAATSPFHEDFFIVVDRLYGTLEDRINEWKSQEQQQQQPKVAALWNALSSECRARRQQQRLLLWEPRYQACHDLASALEHLHQHRIVHRDIKPQNIGYNIRGDLTLFDFGLSRELPSQQNQDGLYKMTGYVGSPRYMAPEIANRQPYNRQCDVYSFAVQAWQILTLDTPFEGYQIETMRVMVWKEPFARPDLSRLRHNGKMQSLIDKSWSCSWKDRPTIRELRITFRQELIHIRNGDSAGSKQSSSYRRYRQRSTFDFPIEKSTFCPSVAA